jgi:hypothetical protein
MTIPRNLSVLAEGASSTGVLNVSYGGTGLTSLTAGYIPYGSGTSAFNSNNNLSFDGTSLYVGSNTAGFGTLNIQRFSSAPYASLTLQDYATPANGVGIYFRTNSTNPAGISTAGSPLAFYLSAGASEAMRLHASGGFSIGNTTDPGSGNLSVTGTIASSSTVKTAGYLVASLPTGITGARTYVTNALTPTFGATVVGGGAITVPVFYNGSNWIVG